jgi:hypothetical protein
VVAAATGMASPATANPGGDGGLETWVDGPGDVQPGNQRSAPDAAMNPAGQSIYVWTAFTSGGDARNDIYLRVFDPAGTPQADPIPVNTLTPDDQLLPRVAVSPDGSVLLLWEKAATGDDEIWARMFSSALSPLGSDFRVNTLTENTPGPSRVGAYGSLGFLAVWGSAVTAGDDNDGRSIQGRMITGNNQFAGPQFQVNGYVVGDQNEPAVGGMGERVSIVWWSPGIAAQPLDDVIVGEAWSVCGIFCDSFEN